MNNLDFEVVDSNNNKYNCKPIYNFTKNNKNYLLFTDGNSDDNGRLNIFASRYEIVNNELKLFDVDDLELDMIYEEWSNNNE